MPVDMIGPLVAMLALALAVPLLALVLAPLLGSDAPPRPPALVDVVAWVQPAGRHGTASVVLLPAAPRLAIGGAR